MYVACLRHSQARHAMFHMDGIEPQLSEQRYLLKNADLVIGIKCCSHACSNSVKWGSSRFAVVRVNEDAHVTVASLRNSSHAPHEHIAPFLQKCMKFRDGQANAEGAWLFWEPLEIAPSTSRSSFDPAWGGSYLFANGDLAGDPDGWQKVSTCIAYYLRWLNWSDTRWVRVVRCGRYCLRSLVVGVDGVAQLCFADEHVSRWHLNGFRRGTPQVRRYCIVAACAACPAESVLLQLLTDDRLLRRPAELRDLQDQELQRLASLPQYFWERCASLVGECTGAELHSWVMHAAATSIGSLRREALVQLFSEPLSLTRGDIRHNVANLSMREAPIADQVARQLKALLDLGFLAERVTEALMLLLGSPCSIGLVEEAHTSGAVLMRSHPYTEKGLLGRVVAHQCRALVTPSRAIAQKESSERKLARLERRPPGRFGGKHIFLMELIARTSVGIGQTSSTGRWGDAQECTRQHSSLCAQLSPHARLAYDRKARATT